jgi:glycosyltransferase involved in cell wall biosynthesis
VDSRGIAVRIAMVHSFYSSSQPSGENTVVLNEVDALRRAGHEVALFAAHTDELEGEVFYKLRSGLRVATGYGRNPLKAIKDFSPDVVHVHNLFPNLGDRWVDDLDVPLVHTLHNYRPLCANGLLYRDGHVCTRCPDGDHLAGLRLGCYRESRLATLPLTIGTPRDPMATPLLRTAATTLVMSESQRQIYLGAGVPEQRLTVSPHFLPRTLDPQPRDPEAQWGWIFVGRLSEEKGIGDVVRHWPSGEQLTIVGDGPLADDLRRELPPGVELLGQLEHSRVLDLIASSVGLIFPSKWYETFGLVYLEALAAGTPVLATPPSGVASRVEEEGTGSVITSPSELDRCIAAATEHFPQLRRHCREVFEHRYAEDAFIQRRLALYGRLAESESVGTS